RVADRVDVVRDGPCFETQRVSKASREEHSAERHEKRRQGEKVNEHSHQRAEQQAGEQHEWNRDDSVQVPFLKRYREEHADETNDGTDGQINPTGKNYERESQRRDAEKRIVRKEIDEDAQRHEAAVTRARRDVEQQEHDDGCEEWDI